MSVIGVDNSGSEVEEYDCYSEVALIWSPASVAGSDGRPRVRGCRARRKEQARHCVVVVRGEALQQAARAAQHLDS